MTVSASDYRQAVEAILAGQLIGLPTETVYGVGADARNTEAVGRIFKAKGRPADHPLIVHLADAQGLSFWADTVPLEARLLAEHFWPGPLTLILKKHPSVSPVVTGGQDTVGLRVPDHPVALTLLRQLSERVPDMGVAAPSANRFGRISPTTAAHVYAELGEQLALVLDGGPCAVGIESTIVDCSRGSPVILRPGGISPAQLAQVLGNEPPVQISADAPRVSGALQSHYAPETRTYVLKSDALLNYLNAVRHRGGRCGVVGHSMPRQFVQPHVWRMLPASPEGYAREIYAVLRELDALELDAIVVEALPETPDWQALQDRLLRAAA